MLQLQEEAVVMCEKNLLHHMVVFDHLEQFDDVKISVQLFLTLVQQEVLFGGFDSLKLLSATTVSTAEEVHDSRARAVRESTLIQNQMEYVVELVRFGRMADQFFLLLPQIVHELMLVFFLATIYFLQYILHTLLDRLCFSSHFGDAGKYFFIERLMAFG